MQDLIHDFVVLTEHMNFTKAAAALHLSQPGLTKHIHLLEQDLGVELFERDTRPLALTPIGKALLADVRDLDRRCKNLHAKARRLKQQKPRKIIYAAELRYHPVTDAISTALIDLSETYPLLEAVSYQGMSQPRLELLESGKVDVAFFAHDPSLKLEELGYESFLIKSDPFFALVPVHDQLAGKGVLSPSDLSHRRIVTLAEPFYQEHRDLLHSLFEARGVTVEFELHGREDGQGYLAPCWSEGVSIVAHEWVREIPPQLLTRYQAIPFDDPEFVGKWSLVYKANTKDETLLAFIDAIKRAVQILAMESSESR